MKFLLILLTAPLVSFLLSTGCSSPRGSLFLQGESTVDSHRFTPEQARGRFIDVFGPMLDEFGQPRGYLFAADQLHMNEAGYALWTAIIRPRLIAGQIDET